MSMIWDKYTMNLDTQDCNYKKWLITDIPSCHSLAGIKFLNLNEEENIPLIGS